MTTALILIGLLGLLAWLWLDGARARELATGIAESVCQRRGLQFLDGTVSLQRMGLRRGANGMQIRRMFGFDFSVEGLGRHSGYLILLGNVVEQFDLQLPGAERPPTDDPAKPDDPAASGEAGQPERPAGNDQARFGGKVVPFRRPPKR